MIVYGDLKVVKLILELSFTLLFLKNNSENSCYQHRNKCHHNVGFCGVNRFIFIIEF